MNISINNYNHLTSTISSEYVSEQIRTSPPRCRRSIIGITRVGSSEADPTKNPEFRTEARNSGLSGSTDCQFLCQLTK